MQKIIIAILIIAYALGYQGDSCFTYQFTHGNIFHLACNCIALTSVFYNRAFSTLDTIVMCYLISAFCAMLTGPTIGASGFVFALIGLIYGYSMTMKNTITIAFSLALGFIVPNVNGLLHLYCFLFAFFVSYMLNKVRESCEL